MLPRLMTRGLWSIYLCSFEVRLHKGRGIKTFHLLEMRVLHKEEEFRKLVMQENLEDYHP